MKITILSDWRELDIDPEKIGNKDSLTIEAYVKAWEASGHTCEIDGVTREELGLK